MASRDGRFAPHARTATACAATDHLSLQYLSLQADFSDMLHMAHVVVVDF